MAAKTPEIRVFDFDEITKKKSMSESEVRVADHLKVEVVHNEDGLSDDLVRFLHTNPFLYFPKNASYVITSIEDFYISVKKSTISLGTLVRGNDYSNYKKRGFIKKAFKKWQIDFIKNKERVLSSDADRFQIKSQYVFPKIKIITFVLVVLLFFISNFAFYQTGSLWNVMETKSWFIKVENAYSQVTANSWFNIVVNLNSVLLISGFCFGLIYNRLIINNRNLNVFRHKIYDESNKVVEKDFKKKYKNSRNYYLKNIKSKKLYGPLPIMKTVLDKVDLSEIEVMTSSYQVQSSNLRDKKGLIYFFKFITIYLSIVISLTLIGYLLFYIIKNLL